MKPIRATSNTAATIQKRFIQQAGPIAARRATAMQARMCGPPYCPTESVTHFLVKLVFAAPASFLSLAAVSHEVAESV
jgi:hypothetical protein